MPCWCLKNVLHPIHKLYANQLLLSVHCIEPNIWYSVVQWVVLSPLNKKIAGTVLFHGPFCVWSACFTCVFLGSLQVLWFNPTVQKHKCEVNCPKVCA